MANKILVQIDGSNFYNLAKKSSPQTHLSDFSYINLIKKLTNKNNFDVIYYVGEIKKVKNDKKSEKLYASQQKFFKSLQKQKIQIKLGYLLKIGERYHEKGVDVEIAIDMTKSAIKNTYDEFYLLSSDSDLVPAIKTAREEGKKVIYVGFENNISEALTRNCNKTILISKSDLDTNSKD